MKSKSTDKSVSAVKTVNTRAPKKASGLLVALTALLFLNVACSDPFPVSGSFRYKSLSSTVEVPDDGSNDGLPPDDGSEEPTEPSAPTCDSELAAKLELSTQVQMNWYATHGGRIPTPANRARFIPGTNGRIIVLIHGFLSSPLWMGDLAESFSKEGFSVLMPLMTGYGAGPKEANNSTIEDWRASVVEAVDLAKSCYSDVNVVAHSLGAAIITDELVNRGRTGISRVALIAPYFRTGYSNLSVMTEALRLTTDDLSVEGIEDAIGLDPYEYLPIERPYPGEPDAFLPLIALDRVIDMAGLFEQPIQNRVSIPMFYALSHEDSAINNAFAGRYATIAFTSPDLLYYPRAARVGHGIHRRVENRYYDVLVERLMQHLSVQAP
jgi:pimeloyl-ACP methyl ester carboxylesterase